MSTLPGAHGAGRRSPAAGSSAREARPCRQLCALTAAGRCTCSRPRRASHGPRCPQPAAPRGRPASSPRGAHRFTARGGGGGRRCPTPQGHAQLFCKVALGLVPSRGPGVPQRCRRLAPAAARTLRHRLARSSRLSNLTVVLCTCSCPSEFLGLRTFSVFY